MRQWSTFSGFFWLVHSLQITGKSGRDNRISSCCIHLTFPYGEKFQGVQHLGLVSFRRISLDASLGQCWGRATLPMVESLQLSWKVQGKGCESGPPVHTLNLSTVLVSCNSTPVGWGVHLCSSALPHQILLLEAYEVFFQYWSSFAEIYRLGIGRSLNSLTDSQIHSLTSYFLLASRGQTHLLVCASPPWKLQSIVLFTDRAHSLKAHHIQLRGGRSASPRFQFSLSHPEVLKKID